MIIKKLLKGKILFIQLIIITIGLTWASLANLNDTVSLEITFGDKGAHFIAYFVFALVWFLWLYFSKTCNYSFIKSSLLAVLIAVSYGIFMEVLQLTLTTYRSFDWHDAVANTIGAISAIVIIRLNKRMITRLK